MTDWIVNIIQGGGYLGIALLMAIENIFPPIPSEVIMGVGGLAVSKGTMSFWPLLFWGTVGSVAGNYVWYWVGYHYGYKSMRPFIDKHGRWLTVDWEHVEDTSRFFRKHGQWVVFFLRFSPLMRTIISLPAGLSCMNVWKFLIFTAAGSAIWNAALIAGASLMAGWFAGFENVIAIGTWVLIGLMLIGYVYRVITWEPRESPKDDTDSELAE
ncbi:DedA family protein [Croceicoccus mobilis]|uniref:Alkaline phosphatase n=1 Tax=Croceicoccus mobilis TaxID=1703339 RepID=A0A916YWG7_9SPHN|nr:DedA family protein [Croceicoccus mobilis]GGD63827.1 alkaline phosphatase [Croceicoccus mobilis]